jgi:hypothetical protein
MNLRRVLTHVVAATALGYAVRSLHVTRGWRRVPRVATLDAAPRLSAIVPARDEERNIEACVGGGVARPRRAVGG